MRTKFASDYNFAAVTRSYREQAEVTPDPITDDTRQKLLAAWRKLGGEDMHDRSK